ncbi:fatty acid synthase-like [Anticarsia gemmatalis]|uniref:fatty acid synthase-like n=1 Tax=Anticarsia gemmatalis TaxID=129554 RepID=UPI003F76485A
MTPTPQEHSSTRNEPFESSQVQGDRQRIVISGMSGLFPQAHNVKELSDILYNKVNPITSENQRWIYKHPEATQYSGIAPDLDLFDAQFFTVYHRLGNFMDPMTRKLLEQTYQAIYDAGLSPAHLSGKKVAVFVGSGFSSSENKGMTDYMSKTGLGIVGCSKTMSPNRISYWLNVKGPSVSIDEGDCSSAVALEQAYSALRRGDCEAAIVGGSYLSIHPHSSIYHRRMAAVSSDGRTKSFAADADGYTLSDAIGVVFLQKAEDALRVYAELKHVKNEFISIIDDGTPLAGPYYGYVRDPQVTAKFIKEFYDEAQVSPQAVNYVEAYGTGVPDADKSELESLAQAYCEDRDSPLLVGSVTSNIGLTDAASGMAGLSKILLGLQTGKIAANLNCSELRKDVPALQDGRIRVVTEHERLDSGYIALNGMSISGTNTHVLLHGQQKPKDLSQYKSAIPHLVTISGRQESAVEKIFEDLKSRPIDEEELALLHNIHSTNVSGHLGRGYIILDRDENNQTVSLCEKAVYFDDARRPLWFVYSGMGSQWAGMGAQLMRIPIFAAAIERCRKVLEPRGLDIVHIITAPDNKIFDNILHSFVGIAAIQIGLTDILRELGLVPDGIIGHSVGELGCAYADGCLSAEEMILAAYSRGRVSLETELIRGSMAAVGLGYQQIAPLCPPEVDVACRNGPESSTISGPADVMREFVAQLTAKGIFAKEVPCSNIAYHSRYIANAGPNLLKYLKEVIKNPKQRSPRWISSSVPQNRWHEEAAQYCSAEYQTNNLLSPVLFEETSRLIPSNAVLVEVAPHGLLQAILKRSLSADCRHVPLTKRGHPDNAFLLLQAIGNLYMEGYQPKVQAIYPKVQFPVSTSTPMLSHLPEWVHSELWTVVNREEEEIRTAAACKFILSLHDEEHSYLRGNVVRGKTCYPFAAALVAVWDTLAMSLDYNRHQISVQFWDIHLFAQPQLHDQRPLRLHVMLHRGTGQFEVMSQHSRVISGYIAVVVERPREFRKVYGITEETPLSSHDVYQLLGDKDYSYSGVFRSIENASASLREANIVWQNNFVTLIDGMLQLNALQQSHDGVSLPTQIRRICIDIKEHNNNHAYPLNNKKVIPAFIDKVNDYTRCGGVLIQNIQYRVLPPVSNGEIVLTTPSQSISNVNQGVGSTGVTLQNSQIGKLDSFQWVDAPKLEPSNNVVTVHYAGLNMFDVKAATGVTPTEFNSYGMDFSGISKSGDRVMGIVRSGAASTQLQAQSELLWPVPAHWSLEDAATVPLAYIQAFYCLYVKGNLVPGMNVFVHGGAGALGQAAIAIALANNCQVFTTVSDQRKKQFLQRLYPQLKDGHILSSRDGTFADYVMVATNGQGCEIVLSCVKGSFKNVSLRCCAFSGVLIDVVQIENRENYEFGMSLLTRQRSYLVADVASIFANNNLEEIKSLHARLSEGIASGYVRPLSRVTYAPQDVTRAFRLLAESRHRGRVLLRMQNSTTEAQHRITCDPRQCHLLFWNDDVLGVQLADRLINQGAQKVYINYTNPTAYHQFKIGSWQKRGVNVVLSTENLNTADSVAKIIKNATALGAIEGIYLVNNKSDSTLSNVDAASRSLCPELRFFLVASANISGQKTCVSRVASGLPATCLDLSSLSNARAGVDAIEQALCSQHVVVSAQLKQGKQVPLFEQLVALADINVPENLNPEDTLQSLGLACEKVPVICSFLNITHSISLPEDEIPLLSVRRINELEEVIVDVVHPDTKGLATFFASVCSDELLATVDVSLLPTQYNDVSLSKTEFDVSQRYLCIVPGMEGHHQRFRPLCERLQLPALVMQPGLDHPHETVRETAERLAEILLKKRMAQDKFYIMGYESGALVALELASILEDHDLVGTVFVVGRDPDEFQVELKEQLSELQTEEQLQDAIVRHMFTLMAGGDTSGLDEALQNAATWTEKVDACVRHSLGRMPHSAQYSRTLIEASLARINQVRGYSAKLKPLRSQLVLLRAASSNAAEQQTTLQKYSQKPVAVYQLSSSLSYASHDLQCASVINKHLDADTRNAFESQNRCDSYYVKQSILYT